MADKKKMTAAEKKAAAEAAALSEADRKATERKRLIGAGAVLAAIALFVGGYAAGNSGDDDDSIFGADVVTEERGEEPEPPGDGDRFPNPRGGFEDSDRFDFPRGPRGGFEFDLPEGFDFPEGFELSPGRGGGSGFEFPHEFDVPRNGGFEFGFDCSPTDAVPGGFHCDFNLPGTFGEGFEFPFSDRPFGDDGIPPDAAPPTDQIPAEPGFLGVGVTEGADGVVVSQVFPDSPAADGGIEAGDVIASADGRAVEGVDDLVEIVSDAGAGTEIVVVVIRDGTAQEFLVLLGERPS